MVTAAVLHVALDQPLHRAVILLIMLAVCVAMWPILSKKMDNEVFSFCNSDLINLFAIAQEGAFGSKGTDSIVIPVTSVVMVSHSCCTFIFNTFSMQVLLTLFTLWKVFGRWKRANSVIDILPDGGVAATQTDIAAMRANLTVGQDAAGNRMFVPANTV